LKTVFILKAAINLIFCMFNGGLDNNFSAQYKTISNNRILIVAISKTTEINTKSENWKSASEDLSLVRLEGRNVVEVRKKAT